MGWERTLTVHVISMLFFLVPSPFTSAGLDSGAGTQGDATFRSDVYYGHSEPPLSLPADQPLLWPSFLSASLHTVPQATELTLLFSHEEGVPS